jgi:GT2 family glycosyltransferase
MVGSKYFAGFLMTYERHDKIRGTIDRIFEQTRPPETLLIVDNSESFLTQELITRMCDKRLRYYRVGYNAGPAGAAHFGLKILSGEGYEWIYWGDDNDPPRSLDSFERILSIPQKVVGMKVGAVGLMGNRFDETRGEFQRIPNSELKGIMEVDSIAGNNSLIVNGQAARLCNLPDPRLFFGMEELDYCLTLRKNNYRLLIDGDLFYHYRELAQKDVVESAVSDFKKLSFDIRSNSLWREYYSLRNILFVMGRKYRKFPATTCIIIKSLLKAVISFRRGAKFGFVYSKLTLQAIRDALIGNMGKTVDPGSINV